MGRPKKQIEKQKNSTLAIDLQTSLRLDIFSKKHGLTKKEFIRVALDYFERTGIDPLSDAVPNSDMDQIKQALSNIEQNVRDAKTLQADAALKLTAFHTILTLPGQQRKLEDNQTKRRFFWQKKG